METRKSVLYGLLVLIGGVGTLGFRSAVHSYVPAPSGTLTEVMTHPLDSSKLLAASEREVFLREGPQRWKRVLALDGQSSPIRQIISHPDTPGKIFIVTEKGLLEGDLKSGRKRWLFRENSLLKNRAYSLAVHPQDLNQLYLGTERGLYLSGDRGKSWLRPFRWPENQPVELVAFAPTHPPLLLMGTRRELFFSKDGGQSFESGFSLPFLTPEEAEPALGEFSEETSDSNPPRRFTAFAHSPKDPSQLWVGTLESVYKSRDGGIVWQKIPNRGLVGKPIYDLVFSDQSGLIAATDQEVARFHSEEKRWEKIPLGLTRFPAVLDLTASSKETLLVASGTQVLEWPLEPIELPTGNTVFLPSPERLEILRRLIELEPTIRDVQKAAIRYGDLGNGKIKRWHWGSRMRSFIPRVSFEKDLAVSTNIDVDRGGTNNPDIFINGPEDVNKSWNLDFAWELGDLLYSSAQTSIDSRAKLLVELRESILSEVNRIYFERRRIQMEMILSPPTNLQEFMDRLVRFDELTAHIDALTDSFLSKRLEKIYETDPDLLKLFSLQEANLKEDS